MSVLTVYRTTVVLAALLIVQLTGLTCLQDSQIVSSMTPQSLVERALGGDWPDRADDSSRSGDRHDCPCHYLVAYLSGFELESALYTGEMIAPFPDSLHDAPPPVVFHPPLFLS